MFIEINRDIQIPLVKQVYSQIKDKILNGELNRNYKLPSTRSLASNLGVSRNVIVEVYEQLSAEGYIVSKAGNGSYIEESLKFTPKPLSPPAEIKEIGFKTNKSNIIDFRSGLPDLTCFPINKWSRLSKEVYSELTPQSLAYNQPEGTEELRKAIANYTAIYRGVKCHHNQIVITGGTTQAIGLISRLLIDEENKNIVLEDPITIDIQKIVASAGGNIYPVPVDEYGIVTSELPDLNPKAIFVTPSHHFPIGVTMSMKRRIELLKYASRRGSYVIEDDYDSEFRYDVMPTPSLQGLDPNSVIYMGTFSKTLFPALRIGYIILPPQLINRAREEKWLTDLHNSVIDQLILAKYIKYGYYNISIAKMKKRQKRKRDLLIKRISEIFMTNAVVLGNAVGLHISVKFKGINFTDSVVEGLERKGVRVYPVEEHSMKKGCYKDTIILGFGLLSYGEIEKGLKIIFNYLYC